MPAQSTIPNRVPRTCEQCGAAFLAPRHNVEQGYGRYCSRACGRASQRKAVTLACVVCGADFTIPYGRAKLGVAKYCSRACRSASPILRERPCKQCGTCFIPRAKAKDRPAERFCSPACASAARAAGRIACVCQQCGETFLAMPCHVQRGVKFCSQACRRETLRNDVAGTCRTCGTTYMTKAAQPKQFCSDACRAAATTKITRSCQQCGDPFQMYACYANRGGYYCSVTCKSIGMRKANHLGRGHVPYRGWRDAVLQRDGHRCAQCGASNVRLHAHHVKGWTRFPSLRFDVANGLTLCGPCHVMVHQRFYAHYQHPHLS